MAVVVHLKEMRGSPVRMTYASSIDLLLEIEGKGWLPKVTSGQLTINARGQTVPKAMADRIRGDRKALIRLIQYCEVVP